MSSRARQNKKAKPQNDLQQYYADDMIEEEGEKVETRQRRGGAALLEDEEDEDEAQQYTIENEQSRDKLKKENMDKLSDILVSMIFKNKVNSKNAFDVPLPDVQKLTDFHQVTGDTSWKKLSQTLDAGAKIYGFRVDSVHNETYKVLGGLNRTELNQEEQAQESQRRDEDDHDGDQDPVVRKQRRDLEGEGTLEKNMHNIDANKYDLEFDIDPLFQKTSAKFDEGGAKGLLLNNLSINDQLYLMFDSGNVLDLSEADSQQQKRPPVTKATFTGLDISVDILRSRLCPELINFKQTYLKDSKLFGTNALKSDKVLSQLREEEGEVGLKFEDVNVDADQILNDLQGIVGDAEFNEPQPLENYQFPSDEPQFLTQGTDYMTQNILENKGAGEGDEGLKELNFNNIEERLEYFGSGQALNALVPDHRSWMGPETWKVKIKNKINTKEGGQKQKREPKTKKKEQIPVDFNMSVKESWKDVFGIVSTSRKKETTKNEPMTKQAFLLPIDMQIKPVRLANLFSRGLYQGRTGYIEKTGPIKEDFNYDFGNATMDNIPVDQIDPDTQDEIQQNLSTIFGNAAKTGELQFDRPERFINIKVLKEKMWTYLSDKLPTIAATDQNYDDAEVMEEEEDVKAKKKGNKKKKKERDADEPLTFTDVCKDLPNFIDDQRKAGMGISVHSCFVTILHLANEKDLRFKKEFNDFRIYKEEK